MTDFLQDPIYLEFMEKECEKFLCEAIEAESNGDYKLSNRLASDAKKSFSPSEFYKNNQTEFERLAKIT